MRNGTFYGVGAGPGDPELVTIQAARILASCDVIAYPAGSSRKPYAIDIALAAVPEAREKEQLPLPVPMTYDKAEWDACHDANADTVVTLLAEGKDVAFVVIGDPTVYASVSYLASRVRSRGFSVRMVNGITSFAAAAAALCMSLGSGAETVHIIPNAENIPEALSLPGTKVFMKTGSRLPELLDALRLSDRVLPDQVFCAENVGMPDEHLYRGLDNIPPEAGYLSVVIVKQE